MPTKIPEKVDCPKEAVLWAILHKLETIDENASTRVAFATGILYNAQFGLDRTQFDNELDQIRNILKIEKPKDMPESRYETSVMSRGYDDLPTETTLRDEL